MSRFEIFVDGRPLETEDTWSVAAALLNSDHTRFRRSVNGQPRGPLCAMGVCFECRVTIDDVAHRRACMEACRPGMRITTGG